MATQQQQTPQDIVYGIHPVIELLKAKRRKVYAIYTTRPEPKQWPQIKQLLPSRPIQINIVDRTRLAQIAGSSDHQGVVAVVAPYQVRTKPFETTHNSLILMLDGIQDTRNLGAIVRSAYCTGFNGIVLPEKHGAAITPSTHKAAAGLTEHVQMYRPTTSKQAIEELHKAGYNIYLTTVTGGVSALEVAYKKPLCIVIGNEETGISKEIQKSGTMITLPQQQADISYNASVAAGIFMFLAANKTSN